MLLAVAAALFTGSAAVYWRGAGAPPPPPEKPAALAAAEPQSPSAAQAPMAPAAPAPVSPVPLSAAPPSPPPATVTVQVRGAVRRPGVFAFAPGSRVQDAIARAGGTTEEGDLDDINLAAPLIDQGALTIPLRARRETVDDTLVIRRGERAADLNPAAYTLSGSRMAAVPPPPALSGQSAAAASPSGGLIDINRASQAELETLPGIGPKFAADIIAHRASAPFQRPEDLMNVTGIGEKRFDALKHLVTVSGR